VKRILNVIKMHGTTIKKLSSYKFCGCYECSSGAASLEMPLKFNVLTDNRLLAITVQSSTAKTK
jgi:hypothetical protein